MKLLFTYLTAFKGHGGIEKFNKALLKALDQVKLEYEYTAISAYDQNFTGVYISEKNIIIYSGNKLKYLIGTIQKAATVDVLLIGHINLAPIALLSKLINPKLKIILIAHGIDVWYKLPWVKRKLLRMVDLILSVSSFTKAKLVEDQKVDQNKIKLFPNTLDPYFQFPAKFDKPSYLEQRYNLDESDKVILSVCRLSSQEGYKGYDTVIKSLPQVLKSEPTVKYVIVGKYDQKEYDRIISLSKKAGVEDQVILTGYILEEELTDHYLLGDVFVMPSREEGFGIVYIEAMACGLAVIAGNADGSVDALDHGNLGTLVDPTNTNDIAVAITKELKSNRTTELKKVLQFRVIDKFGFDCFKTRLQAILKEINLHVRH
ncbi:glycosyltransferase family 4 protein [Pontibacter fetidus]|uniref:Glycosyltransferase family 4 protein n=1 Tax=Pontibacter fetidus TaxID=2700082 RepID=A0A6B2GXD0_9BACT|nr:glycosyltransferase family 4 protein [Pontibacter fetidus]NDK54518.1 glycosyltransferase family 4 protein [Pontibacter fetidus]